jgi:SPP1 family predicted phage head-tail adaptor
VGDIVSLNAGDLNRKVTIQAPIRAPDGAGGWATTWNSIATVAAQITPISGGEALRLGVERSTQFYKVSIRFRSDVTSAHRLLFGAVALNIRTCSDPDGTREELAITAESGVADG